MLRNTATDDILAVYKVGEPRPEVSADLPATPSGEASIGSGNDAAKVMPPGESGSSSRMSKQPYRLPKGGLIDRDADAPLHLRRRNASPAIRATRSPRRCLRTASTWWRARSNIIGRAASLPPAARSRRRWWRSATTAPASIRTRASTEQELFEGLKARPQNCWPTLGFDIGALNDLIAPFIPAGFYYKTFKGWPGWMAFEPLIRRAAGLGRAPALPDPDRYEVDQPPLRRARRRRRAGRADGGARGRPRRRARDPLRGDGRARRHASRRAIPEMLTDRRARRRPSGSRTSRAELRGDAGGDAPHPHHRLRLLLAQFRRALGARHRSSAAGRRGRSACRASGSGACGRRRSCSRPARSSARWSSTRTTGRASCSPARCAPTCTATACCRESASSSPPTTIPAGTRRSTWRAPAARSRRSSISAPRWRRSISPRRRGAASRSTATPRSSAPRAGTGSAASRCSRSRRKAAAAAGRDRLRPPRGRRRLGAERRALRAVARKAPLRRADRGVPAWPLLAA